MGLNVSWMITLPQPYLANADHEADLHTKSPLQVPSSPTTNDPVCPLGFLAALTQVKPSSLEAGGSCSGLSAPAAATAVGRTDIQAADLF